MNPIWILAVATGAYFLTKKPKAAKKENKTIIPELPGTEDPVYIAPQQEEDVRQTYTQQQNAQASAKPATSAKPKITTPQQSPTQGGKYYAFNKELADGKHLVNLTETTHIGVVDTKISLGIYTFKNIPKGQSTGRYSGRVYQSANGARYLVANGYRSGLYYYVPIKSAVISTRDNRKRIIVKDIKNGEYIIS